MRIAGAALVNRFYVEDGWTRKKVAELLNVQDERYVTPRYWKEKTAGIPIDNKEPIVYFAVYDVMDEIPTEVGFVQKEVEKHEYEPFGDGGERAFSSKNRMAP